MTDEQTNGMGLDSEYAKAAEYATVERLRREQQFAAAKQEIEELRVQLAECEARLKAMNEHNDFLEDRLNLATMDRTEAIRERAEAVAELKARHDKAVVSLDNIRKILEKPLENGG